MSSTSPLPDPGSDSSGMGVVLVLAADYLLSVASRSRGPSEGSRMAGVALVAVMLTITMAQTTLDTYRGFRVSLPLCEWSWYFS